MRHIQPITWRRSSRSNSGGGQCVEVGAWRKSSRSASGGNANCVEAGSCPHHGIAVRDSKAPDLGTLPLAPADWTALLTTIKSA